MPSPSVCGGQPVNGGCWQRLVLSPRVSPCPMPATSRASGSPLTRGRHCPMDIRATRGEMARSLVRWMSRLVPAKQVGRAGRHLTASKPAMGGAAYAGTFEPPTDLGAAAHPEAHFQRGTAGRIGPNGCTHLSGASVTRKETPVVNFVPPPSPAVRCRAAPRHGMRTVPGKGGRNDQETLSAVVGAAAPTVRNAPSRPAPALSLSPLGPFGKGKE